VHAHVCSSRQNRPTGNDSHNEKAKAKLYEVAIRKYQLEVKIVDNPVNNLQIRETEVRLGFPYSHMFAHEQLTSTTDGRVKRVIN
jgi:hypothetical protein